MKTIALLLLLMGIRTDATSGDGVVRNLTDRMLRVLGMNSIQRIVWLHHLDVERLKVNLLGRLENGLDTATSRLGCRRRQQPMRPLTTFEAYRMITRDQIRPDIHDITRGDNIDWNAPIVDAAELPPTWRERAAAWSVNPMMSADPSKFGEQHARQSPILSALETHPGGWRGGADCARLVRLLEEMADRGADLAAPGTLLQGDLLDGSDLEEYQIAPLIFALKEKEPTIVIALLRLLIQRAPHNYALFYEAQHSLATGAVHRRGHPLYNQIRDIIENHLSRRQQSLLAWVARQKEIEPQLMRGFIA